MAYLGSSTVQIGTTTTDTISRDVYLDTLEAFNRTNITLALIYKQTIMNGHSAQFIIGGKSSEADASLYAAGTQVTVTDGTQDERIIALGRPQHIARRVDQFDEKVSHWDIISVYNRQMGEALAHKVDRANLAMIETSAGATGLAGNPGGSNVVNTALPGGAAVGATPQLKGDALAESIFEASAELRANDDNGDAYVVLSPINYSYLVQSGNGVNADYTSGNGGYDTGKIMEVGGVKIFQSNNLPGTAGLVGLVFTSQAIGLVELIGLTTNQEKQIDFLDSTLMTAYYANGVGVLRPESAVKLLNA